MNVLFTMVVVPMIVLILLVHTPVLVKLDIDLILMNTIVLVSK